MFAGIIKQKPWTKSLQSFCAQGSEYYVLVQAEDEWVIRNESGQELASFEGQEVKIEGELETKIIKPTHNLIEQRPVMYNSNTQKEADFTCTVLVVRKIQ